MTAKKAAEKAAPPKDRAVTTPLQKMREPFQPNQIGKLAKGTKAQTQCKYEEKKKCDVCGGFHHPMMVHLDYVGHAALTDRLLDCDQHWDWQPLAFTEEGLPRFDESGGLWIKLTVAQTTRLGYGNAATSQYKTVGDREKEVIGDALRNAAMRFGAALDLWHKGDWDPGDDQGDSNTKPDQADPGPKPASGKKTFKEYFTELKATKTTAAYKAWWKNSNLQMQKDLPEAQYNSLKTHCVNHSKTLTPEEEAPPAQEETGPTPEFFCARDNESVRTSHCKENCQETGQCPDYQTQLQKELGAGDG